MTKRRMRSVSQRNPADPEHVVGSVFRRGPAVAADGGERGAGATQRPHDDGEEADGDAETAGDGEEADEDAETAGDEGPRRTADGQRMKDVDQTPPDEDAGANNVWERGGEPTADDERGDDE